MSDLGELLLQQRSGWYAVRCLFKSGGHAREREDDRGACYEERITLWQAASIDEAIARAEAEAAEYAAAIEDDPSQYLELAQAYTLFDHPGDGSEIFSLMRSSTLEPSDYLDTFFDTGSEHQDGSCGEAADVEVD